MNYLQLIVTIIFILLVILYFLSLINSFKYKVPQISTFRSDFKVLKKYLGKYNLEGKKIIDLGSGIGKVLRFFEKEFNMKPVGYEIDLSNVIISKIINKIFSSKVKVIKGDYFKTSLKEYDFIYVYLFPELMDKIETKIWKEAKKGTIIFSNAFKFNNHKTIDIFYINGKEEIFVYKI